MSIRQQTIQGVSWTIATRIVGQVLGFAVSVLLARLLSPGDYGLPGMTAVFTGFAATFVDFGIGSAILQKTSITQRQLSSAFFATITVGAGIGGLVFVLAPKIAAFYGRPELVRITEVSAGAFLLSGVGVVPRSVLQREMAIKKLMIMDFVVNLTAGGVSLLLAAGGAGVWTIVVAGLWTQAGQSFAPYFIGAWRPGFAFAFAEIRPLLNVSLNLLGFNILNYWARNFDNLLVGRMLGEEQLGVYIRAYSLMLLPLSQIVGLLGGTLLPALSRIHEDKARSKRLFMRALGAISLLAFPAGIGLSAVADPFVRTLYGVKWIALIPIVRILAPVGALQALCNPVGWLFVSQGRTDGLLRWGVFGCSMIIIALGLGAIGRTSVSVAWAYLIVNVLIVGPCLSYGGRVVGLRLAEVVRALAPTAACTLAMGLLVLVVDRQVVSLVAHSAQLAIEVVVGVVSYFWLARLTRLDALRDVFEQLRGRWEGRHGNPVVP